MHKTKEMILLETLTLFSSYGYEAVSVQQIANAVGIKAPSLYKHFKSKQDIFQAILDEMQHRYEEYASSINIPITDDEFSDNLFINISEDDLVNIGNRMFSFFLHDEYQSKFRKLLTIEQFHNHEISNLYMKQYYEDAISYQSNLFSLLSKKGSLIEEDPIVMALQFYAPIYLLLSRCDCQPEKEKEVYPLLESHIRQFSRIYTSKNKATK